MGIFDFFKKKKKEEKVEKQNEILEREKETKTEQEYETEGFQLLFSRKNCNDIAEIIRKEFEDIIVENSNIKMENKSKNEDAILLNDNTIINFEIMDNYEENVNQIFGMNNFYQGAIKGDESEDFLNNVFTQIKLSNFITHIRVSKKQTEIENDYFYDDKVYNIAKKLNALVTGNMGFRLFNSNKEMLLDMYKTDELTAKEFVCNITEEDIKNYEIPEKYKNWILSHLENFKSPIYKNKFIDDYKSFDWNMWLVSNGKKIAKSFVKYFEKELINVYDENGNKFDVNEETKKFVMELKEDVNILVDIKTDNDVLNTSDAMANYFSDVKIKDEFVKNMVLYQLYGFDCNVRIEIAMNKEKILDKKKATKRLHEIMENIEKVCEEHKAYFSMEIDEIKRYDGKILISKKKGTEMKKDFRPFVTTKRIDNFEMTEEDKKRMARSIEKIKNDNLPFVEGMHVSISEATATLPEKESIIKRMIAMLITGIASEIYNEFGRNSEEAREGINNFIEMFEEKYGFKEVLNEREKAYLETYIEDDNEHNEFNWRYECPPVFLWALSLWELTDLSTICDFREIIEYTKDKDLKTLVEISTLKSKDEIMDMLDYLYRLDWSAVDMRVRAEKYQNAEFPYDKSIIHFRRLALEWLVQSEKSIEEIENEMHT